MNALQTHRERSALDQDRVVFVHVEVDDIDALSLEVEQALLACSSQSLATLRPSRREMILVFCCIADAVAFAMDSIASPLGPFIRIGVHAQAADQGWQSQRWELEQARKLAEEAILGGLALCRESYLATRSFFEGGDWFVALYEDSHDQVDIAAVSRMPTPGSSTFSTFAELSSARL